MFFFFLNFLKTLLATAQPGKNPDRIIYRTDVASWLQDLFLPVILVKSGSWKRHPKRTNVISDQEKFRTVFTLRALQIERSALLAERSISWVNCQSFKGEGPYGRYKAMLFQWNWLKNTYFCLLFFSLLPFINTNSIKGNVEVT